MRSKSSKSYTAEELAALRKSGSDRTNWDRVDSMSDEEVEWVIASDEDEASFVPDWTRAELVIPEAKQPISLRVDRDVLQFFKRQGRGYQSRMNAVLRAYMLAHHDRNDDD